MATLMLTVLPGELLGDQFVEIVVPPLGALQSSGAIMPEMSEVVQV